ncbi:MAG TPA: ATP-binding protein [Kofleriaceae bacterium]
MSVGLLTDNETTRAARQQALDRFEHLALPAAILDATEIRFANEEWRRSIGTAFPEWARAGLELVLRTGVTLHLSEVITRIGDRNVWLAATLTSIRSGEHHVGALICREMTDAAIGRELRVSSDACVWSGAITTPTVADYCNEQMRALCGEAPSLNWQSLVYPDDIPRWTQALAQASRQRQSLPIDLRLLRQDGRYQWHSVRVLVTTSNTRWFSVAVDCHHERSLEAERGELLERVHAARLDAERAHRVKDQVLAAVSHELRAPVTTLMLWERVLRDPMADTAARLQALDAIRQSATAQSRIVADLLDMSRAISGKLYVDFRSIEIGRVVGESTEAALPAALAKRISLMHETGTFNGEISGDAARLRQVLDNLLSNAIKFTEPGGRVTISMQRKGRIIVIQVEDTGCGIPPKELDRIFEPFSQGSDVIAKRHGGLGLGLAISRQIVELHHGTLSAYSEGPARGARLTLTLPVAGQPRAPSPPSGVAPIGALKAVRVLVIDDDERVRNALALLLDRAGAIVDRAESATAARQQMSRGLPQVIICDIAMPDEDGYTFIRGIRASGSQIPAIALTAYASRADAEEAVAAGFDLHVAKPVDFQNLVTSLTQVIDLRRNKTV